MCEEENSNFKMDTEVVDTPSSISNTNRTVCYRARAFQFTLNEIDKYETLKSIISSKKSCDYYISCKEIAPTTGHEHIHMYAHFRNPYRLCKEIVNLNIHIEKCDKSPARNIAYIEKDGNILDEWGIRPSQGMHTVGELMELESPKDLKSHEYNTWMKIHTVIDNDIDIEDWHKEVKIYYIFGPSGIGKTEKAKQIVRDNKNKYGTKVNVVKREGDYWNGTGKAKIAIYDEFRDSSMKPSEFINFIDYNKHQLNIKGGSIINNYELIIITSVQNPKDIYPNVGNEPREQWLRRMEIIDMNPKPIIKYYDNEEEEDNEIDVEDL